MNKRQIKKAEKIKAKQIGYLLVFPMVPLIPLSLLGFKYSDRKAIIKAWKKVNQ
ncbi:MAG: hypothetical protein WBA74_10360 [Cyclobacteriaceae bacterium]